MALYTELPQEEQSVIPPIELPPPQKRPLSRLASTVLKASVCLLAIWGLIDASRGAVTMALERLSHERTQDNTVGDSVLQYYPYMRDGFVITAEQRSCRCGSTVSEAISNNCKYDSLAAAWLPPHCRDEELIEEWDRSGSGPGSQWEYWADKNRTIPLSLEQIAMLPETGGLFHTTHEWHVKHCTFGWRKLYRSVITGITMDRRSDGIHHIEHCEMMALKQVDDVQGLHTVVGVSLDADMDEF